MRTRWRRDCSTPIGVVRAYLLLRGRSSHAARADPAARSGRRRTRGLSRGSWASRPEQPRDPRRCELALVRAKQPPRPPLRSSGRLAPLGHWFGWRDRWLRERSGRLAMECERPGRAGGVAAGVDLAPLGDREARSSCTTPAGSPARRSVCVQGGCLVEAGDDFRFHHCRRLLGRPLRGLGKRGRDCRLPSHCGRLVGTGDTTIGGGNGDARSRHERRPDERRGAVSRLLPGGILIRAAPGATSRSAAPAETRDAFRVVAVGGFCAGQSATWEPIITVRFAGNPKWSIGLDALRAIAMNRCLRQRCMLGASVGAMVIRETK